MLDPTFRALLLLPKVIVYKSCSTVWSSTTEASKVLGLSDFTSPWTFAKTITPIYISW